MHYQLMNSPRQQQIRSLYRQVLADKSVVLQASPPQHELLNGGVVVSEDGRLEKR